MNKRPVPLQLQSLSRLVAIACVLLTIVLICVVLFVGPAPPAPCPPQTVTRAELEAHGGAWGSPHVPDSLRAELRRRCDAAKEAR